jgi:hypothetical protein
MAFNRQSLRLNSQGIAAHFEILTPNGQAAVGIISSPFRQIGH